MELLITISFINIIIASFYCIRTYLNNCSIKQYISDIFHIWIILECIAIIPVIIFF